MRLKFGLNSKYWMAAAGVCVACVLVLITAYWLTGRGGHGAKNGAPHLDFNKDVQPVLASNCFSCHGPDPAARKAGLRLDLAETAFKKRPGHRDAIVPGHPEQSELIARIESTDPHHLMPQTAEGEAKPMKAADIAVLKPTMDAPASKAGKPQQPKPHPTYARAPQPA